MEIILFEINACNTWLHRRVRVSSGKGLVMSLWIYSLFPLIFYFFAKEMLSLYVLSIVSGLILGINLPSACTCTYKIIPRHLLSRMFAFILATSVIDSVGIMLASYLYTFDTSLPFIVATILLGLGAFICSIAVTQHAGYSPDDAMNKKTYDGKTYSFKDIISKKFMMLASLKVLIQMGHHILFFLLIIRQILPTLKDGSYSSSTLGYFLTLMISTMIVVSIVVNYIARFRLRNLTQVLLLLVIASILVLVFYNNLYAIGTLTGLFLPLLYTGRNLVFSSLWEVIDVNSPYCQSVFLMIAIFGGVLSYGIVSLSLPYFSLWWIVFGYGCVVTIVTVISFLFKRTSTSWSTLLWNYLVAKRRLLRYYYESNR